MDKKEPIQRAIIAWLPTLQWKMLS